MKRSLKLSIAFLMAAALSNTTALTANAQEMTLSGELLEYCADNGLGESSCACFIDGLIEEGVLDTSGELTADDMEVLVDEYVDLAQACVDANE